VLAGLLAVGASGHALAQRKAAADDFRLQELTDTAALAGVNALAATAGQPDAARIEAANTAVSKILASRSEIVPVVSSSIDDMTTSVALTTSSTGKGPAFTAMARYVSPGSAVSPSLTADATLKKRIRG
jgi:hypothetical protein